MYESIYSSGLNPNRHVRLSRDSRLNDQLLPPPICPAMSRMG